MYFLYRNQLWLLRRNFHGMPKLTALAAHALLATPKHFMESLLHSGFNLKEISMISRSLFDGLFKNTERL